MTDLTKEQIDKIISKNQRLLFIMGVAVSELMDIGRYIPEEDKDGLYWIFEAMNNVIYLDKELPPFPGYANVPGYSND